MMLKLDVPAVLSGKIRTLLENTLTGGHRRIVSGRRQQETLRHLIRQLEALSGGTEGEFLALGSHLLDFHQRAAAISGLSSAVADRMAGEAIEAVIDGLRKLIADVERLERESQRNAATLQNILASIADLRSSLSGFNNIVRTLRVLAVFIRIESARLGDRDIGFNVLADEVMKLALEIEAKYSHLLDETESLAQTVDRTLARVADLESRRQARAGVLLGETLASLEPLLEKQRLSSTIAATLSTRYEAISSNIGEIVSSMQFHDITRQRIEHVSEALARIATDPPPVSPGVEVEDYLQVQGEAGVPLPRRFLNLVQKVRPGFFGSAAQPWRLAHDVCELQMAQLRSAGDVVVQAVENVLAKLNEIAGLVTEMSRETRTMAGTADAEGNTCFAELETAFSSVTSALAAYAETDRELSLIMVSMGGTLTEMASFADAIEEIGERIKRLALNAIVKASHIGDAGLTLGVLAESVHQLSVDTRGRTGAVSEALRSMASESTLQHGEAATDGINKRMDLEHIEAEVETLLSRVQQVNGEVAALLDQIQEESSGLSGAILTALPEVHVHQRFDSVISDVLSGLEEMLATSQALPSAAISTESADSMQALETAYTMEEERQVHQSLLAAGAAAREIDLSPDIPAAPDQTESAVDGDGEEFKDDLGDNVELF